MVRRTSWGRRRFVEGSPIRNRRTDRHTGRLKVLNLCSSPILTSKRKCFSDRWNGGYLATRTITGGRLFRDL
jgi:hypothetical protein